MAIPSSSSSVEPEQMQDMDQLEGDQQMGTSGIFEAEGITVGNYYQQTTSGTYTVKTGQGVLHTLTVLGGTTGTIIIYDNTSANTPIIASFNTTNTPYTYVFDCQFLTGLTVKTSANVQWAVSYL